MSALATEVETQSCSVCGRPISHYGSTARGMGPTCEAHQGYCLSPFVILVDSNEQQPYKFEGITEDASRGGATIIPRIERRAMYREGLADYSVAGLANMVQVERKSLTDLYGTIGGRRVQFEQEIERLNECYVAYVVIEAEWSDILYRPPQRSKTPPKTISRTIQSWSIKYPNVHWITHADRRHAEVFTYRLLDMFWRKWEEEKRKNGD